MPRPFLSVVVVFYEMERVAKRTLYSLSSAYQQGVTDGDYEVQVVENGSRHPVGEEFVQSFGPNFKYHYLEDAPPSPAYALNYGVARSRADNVALMIDGAHILTPRVFSYTRRITRTFASPIVAVRRFYLGPGKQSKTIRDGYCEEIEEAQLAQVGWPEEPYRLFQIGAFMGNRRPGWFGRHFESNCLIMPRRVYRGMRGTDESFDLPGGGFVNLDLFARCLEVPGAQLVMLLGEGSFHQIHGGTTTNVDPEEAERRIARYREQYRQIRGKVYKVPNVPTEFFGSLHPQSLLV